NKNTSLWQIQLHTLLLRIEMEYIRSKGIVSWPTLQIDLQKICYKIGLPIVFYLLICQKKISANLKSSFLLLETFQNSSFPAKNPSIHLMLDRPLSPILKRGSSDVTGNFILKNRVYTKLRGVSGNVSSLQGISMKKIMFGLTWKLQFIVSMCCKYNNWKKKSLISL
ncbi:hypothetical protein RFI_38212, partial [Reticulomyxa filosa]